VGYIEHAREELSRNKIEFENRERNRLCGLVGRVSGYRSRGPGSIPGPTRFSEK
jgi:hypothetical protein